MKRKLLQEDEALSLLQHGAEAGLDFFFDRYYSALVLYAASITRDHGEAQEIVSEAFVKLWQQRERFEQASKIKYWLYKVVYHASIDVIRGKKVQKKYTVHPQEGFEEAAIEKLIETEMYRELYTLLEKLPPRSRQIFDLFYFQRKSIKEIAVQLQISVNTVKTQKLRAIRFLKDHQGNLTVIILYSLIFI